MLNYIATLPLVVQLILIFAGLLLAGITISAILYRLVRFGVKIKAGPIEIDTTDDTESKNE